MGMLRRRKSEGRPEGGLWPCTDKPGGEAPSRTELQRKRARAKAAKKSRKRNRRR